MQEIFNLINERVSSAAELTQTAQKHLDKLATANLAEINSSKKEFMGLVINLRREEKTRISKENEFLEFIFTLRNFDTIQIM